MPGARRYVLAVLLLSAALSAAAIAFNAQVDPYALAADHAGRLEGERRLGGGPYRIAARARDASARTVILGTSRAQSGIPVDHPSFTPARRPVVNLALGGASVEQMRLTLVHAHTSSPLREAIVGLDLEAFLDAGRSDFDPAVFAGNPESLPASLASLRRNLARTTLYAAIREHWGIGGDLMPESIDAPAAEGAPQENGQRVVVWTTEFRNFHGRLPSLFPGPGMHADAVGDSKRQAAMTAFGELLRYARREGIALHLFISPVHARYLDWYRRVGWWSLYEGWKRGLVAEIEREAREQHGGKPFVLWDMSGFRGPAAEAVPRLADTTSRMQWYLETSHYNAQLGTRILDVVLGTAAPDEDWPATRIDARNLRAHSMRLYADADRWRELNPGETANVAAMVAYLRRQSKH